jgi:hypothetical protein
VRREALPPEHVDGCRLVHPAACERRKHRFDELVLVVGIDGTPETPFAQGIPAAVPVAADDGNAARRGLEEDDAEPSLMLGMMKRVDASR